MRDGSEIHPRVKLAAMWTSVMFLYIYADYFGLFAPGHLAAMNKGIIAPLGPATDGVMLFVAAMMAIPALMIALSVVLPAPIGRWLNLVFGLLYSAIIGITMWGSAHFILYGVIEIALTLAIAYSAWSWRR